jgi:L-2,4-diaminobutyrate transaminase
MSLSSSSSFVEKDKKYFFHPFTALKTHESDGGKIIVEGKGSTLTDSQGNKILDGMAGLWCVNLGYGNTELAGAIDAQVKKLSYYHSFSGMGTDLAGQLSEQIINMCPVPMSKVFFGNSGSDANDTNVKIVWFYNNAIGRPNKKKIISRTRGYHGVTIMSAGLTGLKNLHDGFDLPLSTVRHVRPPHRLWEKAPGATDAQFAQTLADELETLILAESPDTVAAFIAEPIQAAGGVIVPPNEYFPAITKVLKKYDILLIADEVVTGFGRLGQMFGTETFAMQPDIITIAKGLTSAYIPLSGSVVSEKIWSVLRDGSVQYGAFGHGYTYSAHPVAAACALKNLEIIKRDKLTETTTKQGKLLHELLQNYFANHPLVGEIRGQGLIGAIELVANKETPKPFDPALKVAPQMARRSMELGVLTRALPASDTLSFSPPFIVTDSELEVIVKTVHQAVNEIGKELGLYS